MSTLFRRPISCFFCHSPSSGQKDPRSFRCTACGCLNRYDQNGAIISDEPAMHIESLNSGSFAKRASSSHSQLPTVYGKGPFCQTCQSNQLILVNLLSNYLPAPNDPEYSARLDMLPQYRESLHLRYPPVCSNCLPAVEDEIQKKNQMARAKALGGWLNESKGKEQQRRVPEERAERKEHISAEAVIWRIRGFLWAATFLTTTISSLTSALGYSLVAYLAPVRPALPAITLISLLWTLWDPTYSSIQRAKRQGRDVRVRGRETYIKMQLVAWCSRLATSLLMAMAWYNPTWDWLHLHSPSDRTNRMYSASSLIIELTTFLISYYVIRVHQPPAVRLVQTDSHRAFRASSVAPTRTSRSITPTGRHTSVEPEFLAALSLSSNPVITHNSPVFGLSSLPASQPPSAPKDDDDAMDWTPSDSSQQTRPNKQADNTSWLRPQRFFAPEKPTGLEGLFERTLSVREEPVRKDPPPSPISNVWKHLRIQWWAYLLSLLPIAGGVFYKWWKERSIQISHTMVETVTVVNSA